MPLVFSRSRKRVQMSRMAGRIGLVAWILVCATSADTVCAADAVVYEVVDPDGVYYGSGKHPKSPAVLVADDVWAEIPEYKQIVDEELSEEDAKYHILLRKATERFEKALKKLASRDGYDMLGETGAIVVKGDKAKELTDVSKELIKLVTRD